MSCLTRELQQRLVQYLQQHQDIWQKEQAETVRQRLVAKGLCPSSVTKDQVEVLLEHSRH